MAWGLAGPAPKIPLLKESRRTLLIDSERERLLLKFARQLLRDVLVIMQDTGLRPEEVLKMRWEHLNWLQRTVLNPSGKTERARRTVPMSERTFQVLSGRKTGQSEGWVFPSPSKDSRSGHFSLSAVEHQFKEARQKPSYRKSWCFTVRHTNATDALARTGNLAAVMDTMGHASVDDDDLPASRTGADPGRNQRTQHGEQKDPEQGRARDKDAGWSKFWSKSRKRCTHRDSK